MERFKLLSKKIIFSVLGLVILAFVGYMVYAVIHIGEDFYKVKSATVYQDITVSGKAKSQANAALGFESGGKIASIDVKEGDLVEVGASLATVEKKTQSNAVVKAQSALEIERKNLAEAERGARTEDVQVSEAEFSKSAQDVEDAKQSVIDEMKNAYVVADDAVLNKTDQFFTDPRTMNPKIVFAFNDYDLKEKINSDRVKMTETLNSWKKSLDGLSTNNYSNATYALISKNLNDVRTFLDKVSTAVTSFETNNTLSQDTIDKYKSDVALARSGLAGAFDALSKARQAYNTALSAYSVSKNELTLKKSGSSEEALLSQQERVRQAEAELEDAKHALAQTTLVSPIRGVVSNISTKKGEVVGAGEVILSVVSPDTFELEANMPEVHVGKVSVGQKTDVVFDAFPETHFVGSVVNIDESPTLIDGVVNYKTTIRFDAPEQIAEQKLRTGMSATVVVHAVHKESALVVPSYLVAKKSSGAFVTKAGTYSFEDTKVSQGVVSDDGFTEILSGLNAGDDILISPDNKNYIKLFLKNVFSL